jgi:polyhydroxybutyrate depolymerase
VRRNHRVARVALALGLTAGACSRADLDAITRPPATDGGTDSVTPVTCPSPALSPGVDRMETVQVGGISRSYILHVPPLYDGGKPVPLVVDFHALASSAGQERAGSPYTAVTEPEGVVTAFPMGLVGPAGTAWNVGPCCVANVDDVAFARALVAQVSTTACIDAKKVYAVGLIMGGGMAYTLACHAADVFAAVASSGFDLLQETVDECQPPRPVAVVSFRGTADNLVPYDGGPSALVPGMPVTFLGARGTFQKWAAIDGCAEPPSAEDANGCATYGNCRGGVEVMLCTKQGNAQDPGNAGIAWPVLKRHPLP